jgi:hypothetical protein
MLAPWPWKAHLIHRRIRESRTNIVRDVPGHHADLLRSHRDATWSPV